MKKLNLMLVLFSLVMGSTSCNTQTEVATLENVDMEAVESEKISEEDSKMENEEKEDMGDLKTLIVYFSATGNTKAVAEEIADMTGADIYEIVPENPYTDEDLNYRNDKSRANTEMKDISARPAIAGEDIDISSYDKILLGYPIWHGTMPRIINTFVEKYDFSNKTIVPFCTSGGSGISTSVSDLRNILPDADIKDGFRAEGPEDAKIKSVLEENGILK